MQVNIFMNFEFLKIILLKIFQPAIEKNEYVMVVTELKIVNFFYESFHKTLQTYLQNLIFVCQSHLKLK